MVDAPSEFFLPVHGLRRSKSESSKTKRISVMERIERFEEHARSKATIIIVTFDLSRKELINASCVTLFL